MSVKITKGIVASPGIKIGKAYVFKGDKILIPKYIISEDEVKSELKRLQEAVEKTKLEITGIQNQIAQNLSKDMADIFASHLMVLEDPQIIDKARTLIIDKKRNVEWVINDISLELIESLEKIEDEYLKERIIDISDINKRLISNLQKKNSSSIADIHEEVIIFAPDLTPSDTAMMDKNYILSFVTDKGGRTSHTAIMARALGIPAIVGTINATSLVKTGDTVIVDAIHSQVIINPTDEEIKEFHLYQKEFDKLNIELSKLTPLPSQTSDNVPISIYGNIEIPEEMRPILEHGGQGIGLFRSEFLFLHKSLPGEELQFNEYKKVIEFFNPLPVTVRTLDVGGDKVFAYTDLYRERNPFLGCRAIRFSLEHEDLFRIQLRAILRASAFGKAKLMFPMVTTLEEFLKAKEITHDVMNDLKTAGIPYDEKIPIGLMIEIPSAVIIADLLSKHADFFSVGTNDLVQYLLAVDRINEKIAYLYNPLNIAVLRFLKQLMAAIGNNSIPVSICGEIANDAKYTMLLLGLGFRELSMSHMSFQQIKKIIRAVSIQECEALAEEILNLSTTEEIEARVSSMMKNKFPDTLI